jgi:hypothetical protein
MRAVFQACELAITSGMAQADELMLRADRAFHWTWNLAFPPQAKMSSHLSAQTNVRRRCFSISSLPGCIMRLRPAHVMACVVITSVVLIACASVVSERAKDILLGLGLNLLSSVVFFVLLEVYWRQAKRANGKEVDGFDYAKYARNVKKSQRVRMLCTFFYPFTNHPAHVRERQMMLEALGEAVRRPSFEGVRILVLHPTSWAAQLRASERQNEDVIARIQESVGTLRALVAELDGEARHRLEVRLFARMPPFALFQSDDFASISFYYRNRAISEVTRYEFFMDSPIGLFVERTFDDLWRDEQTVTLEEYSRHVAPAQE